MTKIKQYISDIDEVLRDLIFGIALYFIVISLIGVLVVEDRLAFVLGALTGCVVSCVMAVHMYRSLDRGLDMDPDAAGKYIFRQSMLRLFMMLVAVYLSLLLPRVSPVGVILGLLGLKLSGLMRPLVSSYITTKIFREGE